MAAGPEYVADAAGSYDWSGTRHVIDVGGGSGALLVAVLEAHPHLGATLVDLPDTVERGRASTSTPRSFAASPHGSAC